MLVLEQNLVLSKVISGGQIGADIAGLVAAKRAGLETGGFAPLTFRIHNGTNPDLGSVYGLVEDSSFNYKPRTMKNVVHSDGTIILAKNMNSPGCALTSRTCVQVNRPCLQVLIEDREPTLEEVETVRSDILRFLIKHQIKTVNIAGNRDHIPGNVNLFNICVKILESIFKEAKELHDERTS